MLNVILSIETRLHLVVALRLWRDGQLQNASLKSSLSATESTSTLSLNTPIITRTNQCTSLNCNHDNSSAIIESPTQQPATACFFAEADLSFIASDTADMTETSMLPAHSSADSISSNPASNDSTTHLPAQIAVNQANQVNQSTRIPTIIGYLPLFGSSRWPRTKKDVEADLLVRLANDFDLLSMASGLRWLCSGWCVASIAQMLRRLGQDWPAEVVGALGGLLLEGLDVNRAMAVNIRILEDASPAEAAGYIHMFLHAWNGYGGSILKYVEAADRHDYHVACKISNSKAAQSRNRNFLRRHMLDGVRHGLHFDGDEAAQFHMALDAFRSTIISQCMSVAVTAHSLKSTPRGDTDKRPTSASTHYALPKLQQMIPRPISRLIAESFEFNGVQSLLQATTPAVKVMTEECLNRSFASGDDTVASVSPMANYSRQGLAGLSFFNNMCFLATSQQQSINDFYFINSTVANEIGWQPGYRPERRDNTMSRPSSPAFSWHQPSPTAIVDMVIRRILINSACRTCVIL
ncbi:hypothetical protein BDF19DRAFT_443639 [Syncephalis fuscata]|nr:hypothetical protein BDF19DRAFT_443639 [Syncephalis fuscata]